MTHHLQHWSMGTHVPRRTERVHAFERRLGAPPQGQSAGHDCRRERSWLTRRPGSSPISRRMPITRCSRKAAGSLRFEITDGKAVERWRVEVRKGDVVVSRKAGAADCVLRAIEAVVRQARLGPRERDGRRTAGSVGASRVTRPGSRLSTHPAESPAPSGRITVHVARRDPERRVAMAMTS